MPLLQFGMANHQQGFLNEAEQAYRGVLSMEANQPDALHLLGVLEHQRGRHAAAIDLIDQAIAVNAQTPSFYCNLADAHRALGNLDAGVAAAKRALQLRPDYFEARNNLGTILFAQQDWEQAAEAFRHAIQLRPEDPRGHCHLGDVHREQGRFRAAIACYETALQHQPDFAPAHLNLGPLLLLCGEPLRAVTHCRRAVELQGGAADALINLGKCLRETDQFEEALHVYSRALELDTDSPVLCSNIGEAWQEMGNHREALLWYERALQFDPTLLRTRCHVASVQRELENLDEAVQAFRTLLQEAPGFAPALVGLAQTQWDSGDAEEAVDSLKEAARTCPEWAMVDAHLGHVYASAGDLENAVISHRQAIRKNGRCVPAWSGLATVLRSQISDEELTRIETLLGEEWLSRGRQASLHFGLAQVFDARGEYAQAADHMVAANRLQKAHWGEREKTYDPNAFTGFVDRLQEVFTCEYFERVRSWGLDTERPVFVVGMPRSGTTLVEQILASHPEVHGAGERRFAHHGFQRIPAVADRNVPPLEAISELDRPGVRELAQAHLDRLNALDGGHSARIVDKLPDNYTLLGFVRTLFPGARIIHCRRDPRDVALSCWITNFGQIVWAVDLDHIAHRLCEYERVMSHWRNNLPGVMLEIDYEETVADLPRVTRRLLEHLDLPWSDQCLEFQKTERLVRTASVSQVRQPIYSRSVGRWRHYEDMLQPLLQQLT